MSAYPFTSLDNDDLQALRYATLGVATSGVASIVLILLMISRGVHPRLEVKARLNFKKSNF